ncbi:MAG: methylenetetrahydrofolate reductase [NAD(P)H] [Bacillota bacterium]|nr:methylenetetrahydrofolate reductase [NAD(P)H] [Bacillota bacterium]
MKIRDMFKEKKPTISFEVFPPKSDFPIETIYDTIGSLKDLNPDFISVTYGAGGTSANHTAEIASRIKNDYEIESIAHLTCISSSKKNVLKTLQTLRENNIENVLALRGDIPINLLSDEAWQPKYNYANELIDDIHKFGGFSIGGAAYPEGHIEANNKIQELRHLKSKVDTGLDFLITQLFFDNELFYQFKENLELLDIKVPIIAGIFPVVNLKQIRRVQEMTKANLPPKFMRILNKYEHNPEALSEAGIAYAIDQIIDLLSSGVDGIHIYTMNRPENARKIMKNIQTIRSTLTQK